MAQRSNKRQITSRRVDVEPDESTASGSVSRSETVTTLLRNMITRGDFPAGFHLQELPIAEQMNVSRTPIRAALTALAKEGLLEPGPKRGYKVRTFSIKEVEDAYEMRSSLEGAACRLLAEQGLEESQIRALRNTLDIGEQLLERSEYQPIDEKAWCEMYSAFHTQIVSATNNALLAELLENVYRVPLVGLNNLHWYGSSHENQLIALQAQADHADILEAIILRQSSRAEARMRDHIYHTCRLVRVHYRHQTIGFDARHAPRASDQNLTR